MDRSPKKRKADDNGAAALRLNPEDALKILEPFTREDLLSIISTAMASDPSSPVLSFVRAVADPARRKLFVHGLCRDTTTDSLRSHFSSFGDLDEAVVIYDKLTGNSKGYGFVTFLHVDGAFLALKEPSKNIDGRMTTTQLASARNGKIGVPAGGEVDSKPIREAPSLPGPIPSRFGWPETALASSGAGHHNTSSPLAEISVGLSLMSDHLPPAGAGLGGFGSGFGGPFVSSSQYPGPWSGGSGGLGLGSSLYHWMPPGSGGMGPGLGSGGNPEGWSYSMGHAGQHHQQTGSPPGQRVPPGGGGIYQGMHHYY